MTVAKQAYFFKAPLNVPVKKKTNRFSMCKKYLQVYSNLRVQLAKEIEP